MMLSLASLEGSVKSIDEEQMEILAAMEHRRWAAVKWMTGWEKGPRDDAGKKHPDLVPYDDLDEPTKQYDRDQVKGIIALVKTIQASRTS